MSRRQDTDPARPVDQHIAHTAAMKETNSIKGAPEHEGAYIAARDRIALGLTVREEFAKAALQGILANGRLVRTIMDSFNEELEEDETFAAAIDSTLAKMAVRLADATIARLGLHEGEGE